MKKEDKLQEDLVEFSKKIEKEYHVQSVNIMCVDRSRETVRGVVRGTTIDIAACVDSIFRQYPDVELHVARGSLNRALGQAQPKEGILSDEDIETLH